jgi:hypothetical protein
MGDFPALSLVAIVLSELLLSSGLKQSPPQKTIAMSNQAKGGGADAQPDQTCSLYTDQSSVGPSSEAQYPE